MLRVLAYQDGRRGSACTVELYLYTHLFRHNVAIAPAFIPTCVLNGAAIG